MKLRTFDASNDEWEAWGAAATRDGLSRAAWIRNSLNEKVASIIEAAITKAAPKPKPAAKPSKGPKRARKGSGVTLTDGNGEVVSVDQIKRETPTVQHHVRCNCLMCQESKKK